MGTRDSSVGVVARLQAGRPGFDPRNGKGFLLFSTKFRPALGSTQPPIQWEPEDLLRVVKWQEREADHWRPSSDDVKTGEAIFPLPYKSSWRSA
jgi:hypothetical protein